MEQLSFYQYFIDQGYDATIATWLNFGLLATIITVIAVVFHFIVKSAFLRIIDKLAKKSASNIDDILIEKGVFVRLSFVFPALVIYGLDDLFFTDFDSIRPLILSTTDIYIIVIVLLTIDAVIRSLKVILQNTQVFKGKPIGSYTQLLQILNYSMALIFIISIVIGKSPLYLLSALGAVTAVLILVFRDTILGLVASIQLSGNDMIRIGDWITVEHYGADGDVIEINLSSVKVRNFDNTITTVPTYALISNSFRNWRGMLDSGGRRIKRSVHIDMHSIQFLSIANIEKMGQISVLSDYLNKRLDEIEKHNKNLDSKELLDVNGRRLTNVGVFRKYLESYVKNHPMVNKELICMVRQLQPSPEGLPLEMYCFSADKNWVTYEEVMADIYDHVFAVAPHFELQIYQQTGRSDMKLLAEAIKN